ncbi:hypothetical protein ACQR0Z_07100 [Bradyrhizobium sp. HKCCYLS3077]|uniref:hypothetical protein n=1 Tax=Bradyrhizobium sp. HKCCYLS3077 TaxID=3420761 RepID=UPI003EBEBB89
MTQSDSAVGNEFDAAKIIVETLSGLGPAQQERALRFASEALGLSPSNLHAATQKGGHNEFPDLGARPSPRQIDIKQFTAEKSPTSDQQFAAVAAYYYQFEAPANERRETISADLLAEAARLATRRRPSRFALNNAKNAGYLDSAGHGEFKLNTVGENLVAMTLPGKVVASGPKRSPRKRKPIAGKRVRKKGKRT